MTHTEKRRTVLMHDTETTLTARGIAAGTTELAPADRSLHMTHLLNERDNYLLQLKYLRDEVEMYLTSAENVGPSIVSLRKAYSIVNDKIGDRKPVKTPADVYKTLTLSSSDTVAV